jgi:acyl carrier protein
MKPADPVEHARKLLAGYPASTIEAGVAFAQSPTGEDLDRLVLDVLAFHLPTKGKTGADLNALPRSTRLVDDLAVDSLALVEMSFLLDDLLGVKLADDELRTLVTIGDLLGTLRKHQGLPPSP